MIRISGINVLNRFAILKNILFENGIHVLKFFLNVSKEEQHRRFLARIDTPEKNWKFSAADAKERGFWDDYMKAYDRRDRKHFNRKFAVVCNSRRSKNGSRVSPFRKVIIEKMESLEYEIPGQLRKNISRVYWKRRKCWKMKIKPHSK